MSDKPAIIVDHVSMKFNLSKEKVDSLKDYVIKMIKGQIQYNEFRALKDVTFTVNKGDRVGILGLNGAGKSTLLKVISGVFKATEGTVTKNGKIVPLLELGAGFDRRVYRSGEYFPVWCNAWIFQSFYPGKISGDRRLLRAEKLYGCTCEELFIWYEIQAWFCYCYSGIS